MLGKEGMKMNVMKEINESLSYNDHIESCYGKKTNIIFTPKQVRQIRDELAKYKRAFEIFKRLMNAYTTFGGFSNGLFIVDGHTRITNEEEELLEELMKDEI